MPARKGEADQREERRHDLQEHRLLRVDRRAVLVPGRDLQLLDVARGGDHQDQHESRGSPRPMSRLSSFAALWDRSMPNAIIWSVAVSAFQRSVEWSMYLGAKFPTLGALCPPAITLVARSRGQPAQHAVEHDEHGHLDQERQAPAERVDLVLLVELHQLFVELLTIALVLLLELLHLGLERAASAASTSCP